MDTAIKKDKAPDLFEIFSQGQKRVKTKELIVFTRQLGTVLNAGVLLTDAINTIEVDLENKYFRRVLQDVLFHVNAGENLSNSLAYYPLVFSPYYVAIIGAAEAVGRLGQSIVDLATFMEEDEKMRLKFLAAIRYPVFLMCFCVLYCFGDCFISDPEIQSYFRRGRYSAASFDARCRGNKRILFALYCIHGPWHRSALFNIMAGFTIFQDKVYG
jgi:type IV pilus assembly protein PilC